MEINVGHQPIDNNKDSNNEPMDLSMSNKN